jgi:hypothetical protein
LKEVELETFLRNIGRDYRKDWRKTPMQGIMLSISLEMLYAVITALDKYEELIKAQRACRFFNIDYDRFFSTEGNEAQRRELLARAKPIFDTVSTQAFQLGYLMAVHSVVESVLEPGTSYDKRLQLIDFISGLFINALNTYFSSGADVDHRTLTGFVNESRVRVFDQNQLGLRRLLSFSVKELNERQWVFSDMQF